MPLVKAAELAQGALIKRTGEPNERDSATRIPMLGEYPLQSVAPLPGFA